MSISNINTSRIIDFRFILIKSLEEDASDTVLVLEDRLAVA